MACHNSSSIKSDTLVKLLNVSLVHVHRSFGDWLIYPIQPWLQRAIWSVQRNPLSKTPLGGSEGENRAKSQTRISCAFNIPNGLGNVLAQWK